jgi:DNA polymerase-3 subunit epsilon
MYIFFDTETNGLPKNYKAPMTDLNNWPRVIQFAWIFLNEDLTTYSTNKFFIKPDGWIVPKEAFWTEKGYSTERCESEGTSMKAVLSALINDINRAKYMIAHNVDFDYSVLGAEMLRYDVRASVRTQKICTMKIGTDVCCIPGNYGFKWPKLEELHRHLFNEDFIGAHDALSDCMATMKCFKEMKLRGFIK